MAEEEEEKEGRGNTMHAVCAIFINIQIGYARDTDHGLRNFNGIEPRFFHVSRMGPTSHEAREMAIAFSDRIDYFHAYGYATRKQITLCPRNTIAIYSTLLPSFQSSFRNRCFQRLFDKKKF